MATFFRHAVAAAVAVTFFAGLDRFLVAKQLWFRPVRGELFVHSWLLWAAFACLAAPVVAIISAWLHRSRLRRGDGERSGAARFAGALALWAFVIVAPVLLHSALDSYLEIGGSLEPLKQPAPWLRGAAYLGAGVAACLAVRAVARVSPSIAALGAAGAGVALGVMGGVPTVEASSGQPGQAPDDAPNILLLVWDTAPAKSLALYGAEREVTPALSALGQQAVVFEEARSTSVFTLTSHLSMLTGTYPSHHGARLMRQYYNPTETPSIARLLRDAGYRTGGFVGTAVLHGQTGVSDGFEVYDDRVDPDVSHTRAWALVHDVQSVLAKLHPRFEGNGRPHWFQDFQTPADQVLESARAWIDNGDDRPWFCFVNLYDVHWPYLPSADASERFVGPYDGTMDGYLFRADSYGKDSTKPPGGRKGANLDADDDRHLTELYEAEFFDLDRKVDEFWSWLGDRGAARPWAALITADHGEAFGEGERYKHDDVLEAQVRVPFILVTPEETSERRAGKVSGVDVAPTLLSLAGLEQAAWMPGVDLWKSTPSDRRVTLVEHRDHVDLSWGRHAAYRGPWKLVVHGAAADGAVELFDLREDPEGLVDVSAEHPGIIDELKSALDDMRSSWGADGQESSAGGAPLSDHLKALGYGG